MTETTNQQVLPRPDRPKLGRVIKPRQEDGVRDYPSAGLTPSGLAAVLREADDGSLGSAMQLFEEMEEKDAHLFAVANTRRLALTGLEWEVLSAADLREGVDRAKADAAADYCRSAIARIDSFDEVLQHLALAVGRNLAVAEIVWDVVGGEVGMADLVPVAFTRLVFDEFSRLRVLTEASPRDGMDPGPNKFIVHAPHSVSGFPQRGGLLRVSAMVYLAKNLSLKDWMIFSEVFGMPVRIARYDPSATSEEKRELLAMMESLGSNAAGVFSRAVELQVFEANRGSSGPPYERLAEFLNREMSKAWLGQTLTTDVSSQRGSLAASAVHQRVRRDILTDDVRKEGRTIRRDLLTPLVRMKFGDDVPVPFFRRRLGRDVSTKELADALDVAVNQLGAKVPARWAHEALGIPQPGPQDDVLSGSLR